MLEGACRIATWVAISHHRIFHNIRVHTNRAGLWSEQTGADKAVQTIYMGSEMPSAIVLPVLA